MDIRKIIKFGITGGLGTVTNLALFFVFADLLKINPNTVNIGCFLIACTQNYIINHLWTFKIENNGIGLSFVLWCKFVFASLFGLGVNLLVLNVLLHFYEWKYLVIPQGIGILAGMILNYFFSTLFVFRNKNTCEEENNNEKTNKVY